MNDRAIVRSCYGPCRSRPLWKPPLQVVEEGAEEDRSSDSDRGSPRGHPHYGGIFRINGMQFKDDAGMNGAAVKESTRGIADIRGARRESRVSRVGNFLGFLLKRFCRCVSRTLLGRCGTWMA